MAKLDKSKYKQALLYFGNKIPTEELGKVKLYKLLYFLDFNHCQKFGKSITGEQYRKLELGPAPEHYEQVVNEMVEDGLISKDNLPIGEPYRDREIIRPREFYDFSVFTEEERATLEETAREYGQKSGKDLTALSHDDPPWRLAKPGERLDYDDTWYRYDPELDEGPDPVADALAESGIVDLIEKKFGRGKC